MKDSTKEELFKESLEMKALVPIEHVSWEEQCFERKPSAQTKSPVCSKSCVSIFEDWQLRLTCMRVRYTGLFIRIHVAVSKHGGMVIDPSYVMKLLVSG